MKEIEHRIYVEDEIFNEEFEFTYGAKRNILCYFEYYNVRKGRESCHLTGTYNQCLAYARYKALDKRYKNFEFLIHLEK